MLLTFQTKLDSGTFPDKTFHVFKCCFILHFDHVKAYTVLVFFLFLHRRIEDTTTYRNNLPCQKSDMLYKRIFLFYFITIFVCMSFRQYCYRPPKLQKYYQDRITFVQLLLALDNYAIKRNCVRLIKLRNMLKQVFAFKK